MKFDINLCIVWTGTGIKFNCKVFINLIFYCKPTWYGDELYYEGQNIACL